MNQNANPSQCDAILEWMEQGNAITQGEALKRFDCMRLPSRIDELHKRGIRTERKMIKLPNGKRIAEYSLSAGARCIVCSGECKLSELYCPECWAQKKP